MISSLIIITLGTFFVSVIAAWIAVDRHPFRSFLSTLFSFWLPTLALCLCVWAYNFADQIDALVGVSP